MGENDEGGFHSKNKIDKGIQSVDVSAGTEMPPAIIPNMRPINPAPHQASRPQRVSASARSKLADIGAGAGAAGPMAKGRR